jgi:hypothetical protein
MLPNIGLRQDHQLPSGQKEIQDGQNDEADKRRHPENVATGG